VVKVKQAMGATITRGDDFTESDLEYMCKYWKVDGAKMIAYALDRTEESVKTRVKKLRKQGLYDYYKNLNKHW